MKLIPGTYKCRDANALGFIPFRRHAPHPDGWRIAGEDADTTTTHDASPLSEQDALRARLHAINLRNEEFWKGVSYG